MMCDLERTPLLFNVMLIRTLFLALVVALASARPAAAQDAPGQIRDAEIENTIRAYATPLFRAAGLDADFVQIYLLNSPQINAFVAGGQRLFIYTGLLMKSESANQVVGVIAHETGHIAGGHLARSQEALQNATSQSIIGFVLGTAGAILSRNGELATAGAAVGQSVGLRSLFAYSVGQEERADQAGVSFLDKTGQSARGMLQFFQILEKEEALLPTSQDPYLRTHPLTSTRVDFVRNWVAHSPMSDRPEPSEFDEMHKRMLAKLRGFLLAPADVLKLYPETDKSLYARYARAAAYHRVPMDDRAIAEMDSLLKEKPDDPYFNELRAQIQFEGGHVAESVPYYRKAQKLLPGSPLLRIELAQALLETGDAPALTKEALGELREAVRLDDSNGDGWHQLAIAEGRAGNFGQAALALAEEGLLAGDFRQAVQQATRATELLPRGSPGWIRADDIRTQARVERGKRS
jgi:predicted Zn-dependent protease